MTSEAKKQNCFSRMVARAVFSIATARYTVEVVVCSGQVRGASEGARAMCDGKRACRGKWFGTRNVWRLRVKRRNC